MEIFFYFFLVVLAVISNFFHIYRFSFSSFFIFFTPCIFIYSFAVRSFGFDVDIEDYASAMAYNSLSLYYLKEPLVWFTQRFLFYYLGDPRVVFYVTDTLIVFLFSWFVWSEDRRFLPIILLFVVSFPFILGFQNIYRQFVSSIFLFCAIYALSPSWKVVFFVLSGLSHNMSGVFFPLISYRSNSKFLNFACWLFMLINPVVMYFGSETKSSRSYGADLTWLYVFAFVFLSIAIFIFRSRFDREARMFVYKASMVVIMAKFLLASAGAERVGIMALFVVLLIIWRDLAAVFRQKARVRAALPIVLFCVMLVTSTKAFIM